MTDLTKLSSKALLAELDAEFGKKPRPRATPEAPHKALNKVFHQRNSTGDARDEIAYANAAQRAWLEEPGWRAIATVHRLHHQHCRMCGGRTSYIANEFTRMHNSRLRLRLDVAQTHPWDEFGFPLPVIVEEHENTVWQCAGCLMLARRTEDLVDALLEVACRPVQRSLWN